ncbi:ATP-binding protein [Flavitalea flava]
MSAQNFTTENKPTKSITVEWLHSLDTLKEVPADQLQWFLDNSVCRLLEVGEFLFKPDNPINFTHIIGKGRIRVYQLRGGEASEIMNWGPGSIIGYLPFSRGKFSIAYGEVTETAEIMSFPIEKSEELIRTRFELTQALVHIMTTRVRDFTAFQQQNEKMMALGKLSAGLAHELNNPAAAVVRGSASLKKHLQLLPETFKQIISIRMSPEEVDIVNDKLFSMLKKNERPVLSMMKRNEKEEELMDWLDDNKIGNSGEIAENMVDFGFTLGDLDEFKEHIPDAYLSAIFNWINSNLVTEKMVEDIEEASRRIGDLVGSVKTFTHMDQGSGKQLTDIHAGIRNTLVMLQFKLRKGHVELAEHFDLSLPPVKAMIGELNQVWTNLIDNALDAMEPNGKGVLEIKTEKEGEYVLVSVVDNGPGIPDEIKTRIFDPFFTTKDIGKGTGMGLDVVTGIVRQHRGIVKVNSVPGRTEFCISLPIKG